MPSLVDRLHSRSQEHGDRMAFRFLADGWHEGSSLTYAELDRQARRIAAHLQEHALAGPVLLLYPSGLDFVAAFYGCLYAGTLAIPAYMPDSPRHAERIRAIAEDSGTTVALTLAALAPALTAKGLTAMATDMLPVGPEEDWRAPALHAGDLAFLQYTSGSTDRPKGVMVSHGNLLANLHAMGLAYGQSEASVFVSWLPLYHDLGLIGAVLHAPHVGASCVLMPPEAFLQDPLCWLSAITRYGGTISGGPNFAYDLAVRRIPRERQAELSLERWEVAIDGAEPVFAETLRRFAEAFAPCGFSAQALHPCYGLAEATLLVAGRARGTVPTLSEFSPRDLERGHAVPQRGGALLVGCGHAWPEHRLRVVAPFSGRACEPGQVGEIWVAGPSVARGYWRRPKVSVETFAARVGDDGPYLRTGDLGFLDSQGELFVTGRSKDLVVIRGVNHYPQDIERTISAAHPAVRPGGMAAFALQAEGTEGLGLAVEIKATGASCEEIARAIARAVQERHELSPHGIALVEPGSLPKTTSGKIRRSECRKRYLSDQLSLRHLWVAAEPTASIWPARAVLRALPAPERTEAVTAALASWLQQALNLPNEVELQSQSLTRLGADSLTAVELAHELERTWGVPMGFATLLGDMALCELARHVSAGMESDQSGPLRQPEALSAGQEAFWFTQRTYPDAGLNHLALALRLRSKLDTDALQRALDTLVARHAALRTVYPGHDGTPSPLVKPPQPVEIHRIEARELGDPDLRRELERDAMQPFDLAKEVLRASHYQRSSTHHVLLLVVHHIAADMWSLSILMDEFAALYRSFATGDRPSLAEPPASPTARGLSVEREAALRAYWKEQLEVQVPKLDLPFDRRPGVTRDFEAKRYGRRITPRIVRALKEEAASRQTTLPAVLLAAYQVFLNKITGQQAFLVGVPMAGRSEARLAKTVGYLANVLPIRGHVVADAPFSEVVRQARSALIEAMDRQDLPFAEIVRHLAPERSSDRAALFQTLFVYEQPPLLANQHIGALLMGAPGARVEFEGLALEACGLTRSATEFDLTLALVEDRGGLHAVLEYPSSSFEDATIHRFARYFEQLLAAIAADFEQPVGSLSLLTNDERAMELARFRPAPVPCPDACLHELFEAQVARSPQAEALVSGDRRLIYRELNEEANRLAHRLIAQGIEAETVVGILAERPCDLVIGILGVLKAGGAYLPLDPETPEERLAFMLEDSDARMLLVSGARSPSLNRAVPILDLQDAGENWPDRDVVRPAHPDQLAYVLYTSGSTGRPKGVLIEHRGLVSHAVTLAAEFGLTPHARCLQFASPAFDSAALEIFFSLASGATLVVFDRATARDPRALERLIAAEGVTTAVLPPTMLDLLRPEATPTLQVIVSAGETCPPAIARNWGQIARFFNGYGPTEATVGATYWRMPPEWSGGQSVPIGRPFPNVELYLLDAALQPVPVGVVGELYLGGIGLARGYLRRPDLEAAAFVANPFGPGRLFRTRDMARCLPDGNLEFRGRADRQLKLRGQRLEPEEIETVLRGIPGIQGAAVDLRSVSGESRLVAYLVPGPEGPRASSEVKRAAARVLPGYMVPSGWVWLRELPFTSSGKVDRARLPEPAPEVGEAPPQSGVEQALARIWAEVLDVPTVGRNDSFFELGGHSLQTFEVLHRVLETFGRDLPAPSLFRAPSVAAFAELLREEAPDRSAAPLEMTDLQQAYWVGAQAGMVLGTPARGLVELACADLDAVRLEAAWNRLVARHAMLRASVLEHGSLRVADRPHYRIVWHNAPSAEALVRLRRGLLSQPSRPDSWPMFELVGVRLAPGSCRLLLAMDLLVCDGWSMHELFRELSRLYADPGATLPPLQMSFADHLKALAARRQGRDYQRDWQYWEKRFDTLPSGPELPYAGDPARLTPRFERHAMRLEAEDWRQFQRASAEAGLTPTAALCAAFCEVLTLWSRDPHFTLNLMFFNRPAGMAQVVGNFSTTSLLEVDRSEAMAFQEFARRLQDQMRSDLAHGEVSGVQVARELTRRRPASFPVVFASTLGLPDRTPRAPIGRVVGGALQTPQVLLDHQVIEDQGGLTLNWDAVPDGFLPGVLTGMASAYLTLIRHLSRDPEAWHGVPSRLLPPDQLARQASLNQTRRELPALGNVLGDLLPLQAAHRPDQLAVIAGEREISYRDLLAEVAGLAAALRAAGSRRGRPVAVMVEKGLDQLMAVLAVVETGCAYLPLDVSWPSERLRQLIEDSGIELAIVSARVDARVAWPASVVRVSVAARDVACRPASSAMPEDPAYVLYTSGTTGRPKGVVLTHAAVLNTLADMSGRFAITPSDRMLALSAMTFDLSVFDLFGTLAAGGTLVLPDPERERAPRYLLDLMRTHGVTVWNSVPAWMQLLVAARDPDPAPLETLRLVLLSGDWIPLSLPERIRKLAPGAEVVSLGGATEAAIWSIMHPIGPLDASWPSIPYGRPMANQSFHVLDAMYRERPDWVPGELFIGGSGLAQGYWKDPERTQERFVHHPDTGERLYRTGDMGRHRPEGVIEFLGRVDTQVKVQGYRIELTEIELALERHPGVSRAVVVAPRSAHGIRLAAYWTSEPGTPHPTPQELEGFLAKRLPPYMIPRAYCPLDSLPLTANGKVDRHALPPLSEPTAHGDRPLDDIEREVCRLWQEVLGIEVTSAEARFLEIGGDSLAAVHLLTLVEQRFGCDLQLSGLLANGTVAQMAAALRERRAMPGPTCMVPLGAKADVPAFYAVHPVGGGVLCYADLARMISVPLIGVQARGWDGSGEALTSIEAMAETYASELVASAAEGPLFLGGWSMGGVIALEMGHVLGRSGRYPDAVVLIDSPLPGQSANPQAALLADLAARKGGLPAASDGASLTAEGAWQIATALGVLGGLDRGGFDRLLGLYDCHLRALGRYCPRPYPGRIVVLTAREGAGSREWGTLGTGPVEAHAISGSHHSILAAPHLLELARALETSLGRARSEGMR